MIGKVYNGKERMKKVSKIKVERASEYKRK